MFRPAMLALGAAGAATAVWAFRPARRLRSYANRTVLISGGSRGFGFALARRFAAEGAAVVLLAREAGELEMAAMRLRDSDAASVHTIVCDVRDPNSVRDAITRVLDTQPRIDVLVNNAGVISAMPFRHARVEDFEDAMATHFWASLHLVRACLPHMARAGQIINIASIGGRIAIPHLLPYTASKFALVGLSEGLRAELGKSGISVTTVTPFLMRTGSHRNVLVRGRHRQEAVWFALGASVVGIDADDAARDVIEAARSGRARVSPGRQARLAEIVQTLMPELSASVLGLVDRWALPAPTDAAGDAGRMSRDVETGWAAKAFPTTASVRFNQPVPPDEARKLAHT